jgi:hypothetical protein
MSVMWTVIIVWLALQIPIAMLVGKCIKFGTVGFEKRPVQARDPRRLFARDPRRHPGVVWC